MTLVQQITPFTCGLACIESLTRDFGVGISQCEMLIKYKELLLSEAPKLEDFGSITFTGISTILEDRGLDGECHHSNTPHNIINALQTSKNGIIWAKVDEGQNHYFRFSDFLNGQLFVMDPRFGLPKAVEGWIELVNFLSVDSIFIIITSPKGI